MGLWSWLFGSKEEDAKTKAESILEKRRNAIQEKEAAIRELEGVIRSDERELKIYDEDIERLDARINGFIKSGQDKSATEGLKSLKIKQGERDNIAAGLAERTKRLEADRAELEGHRRRLKATERETKGLIAEAKLSDVELKEGGDGLDAVPGDLKEKAVMGRIRVKDDEYAAAGQTDEIANELAARKAKIGQ
jgi:chromosome segregation ATPase